MLSSSPVAASASLDPIVTSRVLLDGRAVGFPTPPPAPLRMRFLPFRGRWTVLIQSPKVSMGSLTAWLDPYHPSEVRIVANSTNELVYAAFRELPPTWAKLTARFRLVEVSLDTKGFAEVLVEGKLSEVQALVARHSRPAGRDGGAAPPDDTRSAMLTPHQFFALSKAVEEGYYQVPRKTDLRALARDLGVSASALSETLRRAEERVIASYVRFEGVTKGSRSGLVRRTNRA